MQLRLVRRVLRQRRLQGGRVWDADLAGGGEREMKFGMWQTVNEFSHVHIRLWFYSLI